MGSVVYFYLGIFLLLVGVAKLAPITSIIQLRAFSLCQCENDPILCCGLPPQTDVRTRKRKKPTPRHRCNVAIAWFEDFVPEQVVHCD